uniref:Uncharacterized protein n=1 Tax=Chromera velia CCMP2878 TaxID=1169474 RepID=A0A0G4ID97_9ALVE|eukprot:Cvel_13269.t1-p1 / transcript=Cvel_13269.t1 / gene=Cvel_13269 / organism=Chromera_velia_CCMP2878 / gene_product=hypothetical protein / transcript_product=hypothetical protein / location=Cvel_scaffold900:6909-7727(+) / protein_length=273 / sequence_SO=supercontig / SO=protein_coding / is_pseudo=false
MDEPQSVAVRDAERYVRNLVYVAASQAGLSESVLEDIERVEEEDSGLDPALISEDRDERRARVDALEAVEDVLYLAAVRAGLSESTLESLLPPHYGEAEGRSEDPQTRRRLAFEEEKRRQRITRVDAKLYVEGLLQALISLTEEDGGEKAEQKFPESVEGEGHTRGGHDDAPVEFEESALAAKEEMESGDEEQETGSKEANVDEDKEEEEGKEERKTEGEKVEEDRARQDASAYIAEQLLPSVTSRINESQAATAASLYMTSLMDRILERGPQ